MWSALLLLASASLTASLSAPRALSGQRPAQVGPAAREAMSAQPSRRHALLKILTAAVAAAGGPIGTASAKVDGIPLYAPSAGAIGSSPFPNEGFEVLLPRLEGFASNAAATYDAARAANWDGVSAALAAVSLDYQAMNMGKLATILGDDAYDALALKREYLSAVGKLRPAATAAAAGDEEEAARAVQAAELMSSSLRAMLELVPPPVVAQVRAREKAIVRAIAREEEAASRAADALEQKS